MSILHYLKKGAPPKGSFLPLPPNGFLRVGGGRLGGGCSSSLSGSPLTPSPNGVMGSMRAPGGCAPCGSLPSGNGYAGGASTSGWRGAWGLNTGCPGPIYMPDSSPPNSPSPGSRMSPSPNFTFCCFAFEAFGGVNGGFKSSSPITKILI